MNAENAFRQAFMRLSAGSPKRLPKGSPVTQNNVAREAGRDPSALKKSRHPALVGEIQEWIALHSTGQPSAATARTTTTGHKDGKLRSRVAQLKLQRDHLASLLVEADAKIVELTMECERIRSLLNSAKTPSH